MSKRIQFDLSQFPLLTPKAFAMPDNKEYESKKAIFLAGNGSPPGIYGKDAKLEYNYKDPQYVIQFQQLLDQFKQLAKELKIGASNYEYIDTLFAKIIGPGFNIAASEKGATLQLFKQQLEDVLFGMREAYAQAAATKNQNLILNITKRIYHSFTCLNRAFQNCSEGTTEAIMEQQILWVSAADVATWLLKRREAIVAQVAGQAVTAYGISHSYQSHAGTAARLIASARGYGIASPEHDDQYDSKEVSRFKDNAPKLLQEAFRTHYNYETICCDVYQELMLTYKNALKNYADLECLTPTAHDAVRDKLRDLLNLRVCSEADLFQAIPQTNGLKRINPKFLARLPEYCARYTLLILEQQGYVKNIGQLPIKTAGQWFSSSLDECIQSHRPPPLTEYLRQGHCFMLLALLNKQVKDAKQPDTAFVFNPFQQDKSNENLLGLVCRNRRFADAKEGDSKPLLPDWQQTLLLQTIIQHPAATCDNLTQVGYYSSTLGGGPIRLDRLFNHVTLHCSYETFELYWDRLMGLYQVLGLGYAALATVMNTADVHGKAAIVYALETSDLAKIKKLIAIPGVNVKECLPSANILICCLDAIEEERLLDAHAHFSQFLQSHSTEEKQNTESRHKQLKHFEQLIQLLKNRYDDPEYPHHTKYQAFLRYLAEREKNVNCLLILKKEDSTIDLDQPRLLSLRTGQEVKETPLRVAIKDDDEKAMTHLLEVALVDPDIEVGGESAWLLIANKTNELSAERQVALLQLLMDKSSNEINLVNFLLQLAAVERTDVVFYYVLEKLHKDQVSDYHAELGEDEVERKEFVTGKKQLFSAVRTQQQVIFGREEAKTNPEAEHWTAAKRLGDTCNKIKDSENHGVLYRVVTTFQLEKLMHLLLETIELNFSEVFTTVDLTAAEQKSREEKHEQDANRAMVKNLIHLFYALHQKSPADYQAAQQCFAEFYTTKSDPALYQKLLTMISNHCPKDRAIEFFKQLTVVEKNVSCLQHLRKYVPINLITITHYAARPNCSAQQFRVIWQETVASLPDLSQGDASLNLADLVRCLVDAQHSANVQQQREKLVLVLSDFPIIPHIKTYYQPTATQSPTALDRLINLLFALEQGHMDEAITYYLIDQQQPTENIIITEPMARVLTQQWGLMFFNKFSRQLNLQSSAPTGLVKIQRLIGTEEQKAARLLLQQTQLGHLPSRDLLTNLHLLLQLRFIEKNKPWIFDEALIAFCQLVLAHCSANFSLQLSLILFLIPFDIQAAAQLFCNALLTMKDELLPENIVLDRLKALPQAMVQSEFFSYIVGQLAFREDFRGYDRLLTHCFTTMNTDQPFAQSRKEKGVVTSSPMHVALHTQHYDFLATILTPAESNKLQAAEALDHSPKCRTHLMRLVEIKSNAHREKLIPLWLAHDDKVVRIEVVDQDDSNNALLKALSGVDEKNTSPADEKIALQIWEYALQVCHDNPEKLSKLAHHMNKKYLDAFRIALRKNYPAFVLRLLESIHLSYPIFSCDISNIESNVKNIILLIQTLVGCTESYLKEGIIEEFFNCIERDEKTEEFNTAQVIRVARIMVKQCNPKRYKDLLFYLLNRYSHIKEVASALLPAGSHSQMADILKMAMERGNIALATIVLGQSSVDGSEFSYPVLFSTLLRKNDSYRYSGTWQEERGTSFGTIYFETARMADPIRHAFLDLFLFHSAHLDKEKKLSSSIKEWVITLSCYFTDFLQLCSYDHNNELFAMAEDKHLWPTMKNFLKLVKHLSDNSADKVQLFSEFKQLLLCIENDAGALPMVLAVLKKKLSESRVLLFLNEFLQHDNRTAPDPEKYLLDNANQLQKTVADRLRMPDAKGEVVLVSPSIHHALNDRCNFVTFLALVKEAKYPFRGGLVNSELSMKKNCVLQMLVVLEYKRSNRPPALEYLTLSLNDKEFEDVFVLFRERVKDLGSAIDDLLDESAHLTRIYQSNPSRLNYLIKLYIDLMPTCMSYSDPICHKLIRHGYWDAALDWLPTYLRDNNGQRDLLLTLALKTTIGNAVQRRAFFKKLVAESKPTPKQIYGHNAFDGPKHDADIKTDVMKAAESPCDPSCLQELLKVCSPVVIQQETRANWRGIRYTALSFAVETNQPGKVRVLLETKVFSAETQFNALKLAYNKNRPNIIKIFWEYDQSHQLKLLVMNEYDRNNLSERLVLKALVSEVYYLVYKDNVTSLLPRLDVGLAMIQRYGSYAQLFADEKAGERPFDLLEREYLCQYPLFDNITPLAYALQNKEAAWLLPRLLALPSLMVSAKQVRLVYANAELREQWFIPVLGRFVQNNVNSGKISQAHSLLAKFYIEEPMASAGTSLIAWVTALKNQCSLAGFRDLCLGLLQKLAKQLADRDDVASFLALYCMAREHEGQGLILDRTTGDTAVTFAVQHGSALLVKGLLAATKKPFARKNGSGQSALELTLLRKDKTIINVILEAKEKGGLDLWPIPDGVDSTLMLAVQLGDLTICQNIVERAQQECKQHFTAFLNYKNAAGKSALYLAAEGQREDIVSWLLTLSGIDKDAYCTTTHRTAALCSYQQTQQTQSATAEVTVEAKIEVVGEEASARIFKIWIEHKAVDPATVVIDHQVADIKQHLSWGQQDRAVHALLILVEQQGCQQLGTWITDLSTLSQLGLAVLRRATTDPRHLSLFRELMLETKLTTPLADRMASVMQNLQKATILFSEATLNALFIDDRLKPLWPAAALAYARACRSRPQQVESQLPLMQKIFKTILGFSAAEVAEHDERLPAIFTELTRAQRQLLIAQRKSDHFHSLYEQIGKSHQLMLQQVVSNDDFLKVDWILNNSKVVMDAKETVHLVNVNLSVTDEKTQALQPSPVFLLLERAKQENVDDKDEKENYEADAKKKPAYTTLKMLINHPTWQDNRIHKGQPLLMHAVTADPRIFCKILYKTKLTTLIMPTAEGGTAMDLARPSPEPGGMLPEQKTQWKKDEKNKYDNAKSMAARMQQEFDLCLQHMRTLQADPNAKIKDNHGDALDLTVLRTQTHLLAFELLKFDELQAQHLAKNSLVYSSFLSAISKQTLQQDIQYCQDALRSARPIADEALRERATKLPQFFIQRLIDTWAEIVPLQPPEVEVNPVNLEEQQPSSERRLTFLNPAKLL